MKSDPTPVESPRFNNNDQVNAAGIGFSGSKTTTTTTEMPEISSTTDYPSTPGPSSTTAFGVPSSTEEYLAYGKDN